MLSHVLSPKSGASRAAATAEALDNVKGMKMLQHFRAHAGPVWCAEFSRKGQYLATGGADGLVKIWHIGASEDESGAPPTRERGRGTSSSPPPRFSGLQRSDSDVSLASVASVVSIATTACGSTFECQRTPAPVPTGELVIGGRASRVLRGHSGDVVDLSWSPNAFLLSAGRDGSLRLWHPGRLGCVHLFPQTGPATPTSCAFHPRLENSFATAGEDGKIRVWKITSGNVEAEAQMPSRTTHLRFSPDGKGLAAGMVGGQVRFLTSDTLQPLAQVELRSSRKGGSGSGVSSITFKSCTPGRGEVLISGANGRLRLYRIEPLAAGTSAISAAVALARKYGYGDRSSSVVTRVAKLKGHMNPALPVRASVSEDGQFAVCGSEDGSVHVWDAAPEAETSWGPRGHVSFDGTCQLPADDADLSLSPTQGGRPLSLSPQGSLSPSPRGVKDSSLVGTSAASTAAPSSGTSAVATENDDDDDDAMLPPNLAAIGSSSKAEGVSAGKAVDGGKGKGGSSSNSKPRRRRSPFSRSPVSGPKKSPVARGRGAGAPVFRQGSNAGTSGSGAAVTLAMFVPKAAMSLFEEANGLVGNASRSQNQALRHQRVASKSSKARRRAGIPSIAEVVHGDDRPSEVSGVSGKGGIVASGEQLGGVDGFSGVIYSGPERPGEASFEWTGTGSGGAGAGCSARHTARTGEVGSGAAAAAAAAGSSVLSPSLSSARVVVQRRGSTGGVVQVRDSGEGSSSRRSGEGGGGRKAKKPRGGGGGGEGTGSTGRRSRSHSPPGSVDISAAAREAFDRDDGDGDDDDGDESSSPPPPYMDNSLLDLLKASTSLAASAGRRGKKEQSPRCAPSPPPYDPSARWGWGKEEGTGSRRVYNVEERTGRVRGGRDATGLASGSGGHPVEDGVVSGAATTVVGAPKVVTVDVYRPGVRGRGRDSRRSGTRGSPLPLVDIVMSSPSVSPTPSLSPSPRPLEAVRSPVRTGGGSGTVLGSGGDDSDSAATKWSWDGGGVSSRGKGDGSSTSTGGGSSSSSVGGKEARAPVPPNSLMVATDTLGNVRIFAKEALIQTLSSSAFTASP